MPKLPRLTAEDAEALLLKSGFAWLRSSDCFAVYPGPRWAVSEACAARKAAMDCEFTAWELLRWTD
jgi:hypothetical protein